MTAIPIPPEPAPPGAGFSRWAGLRDAAAAAVITTAALHWQRPVMLIVADPQQADRWLEELRFFGGSSLPLHLFPDRETLPYDKLAPGSDLVSARLRLFTELPRMRAGVIVTPLAAVLHRTSPASHCATAMRLASGDKIDLLELRDKLACCGYHFVQQVGERGEAAIRGSLIDVFPMGSAPQPCRIDINDDRIEQLRWFEVETQRSVGTASVLDILPAAEVPLSGEDVENFRHALRDCCTGDPMQSSIYQGVRAGHMPAGVEYYLPLFFDSTADLFSFLPADTVVMQESGLASQVDTFYEDASSRYQRLQQDSPLEPLLPPERLFLDGQEFKTRCHDFAAVMLQQDNDRDADFSMQTHRIPAVTIDVRAADPFFLLRRFINQHSDWNILLSCESKGALEVMQENLAPLQIKMQPCADFAEFLEKRPSLALVPQPLDRGTMLPEQKIAVFGEPHLFADRSRRGRQRRKQKSAVEALRGLTELLPGTPVVHEDHGVGRYQGLEVISNNGKPAEFILLHYADGDRLYVPVMLAHRIQRYAGTDPEKAPLHKLSSSQWQKSRARAARQAHDTAAELLAIQARRESRQRQPHVIPLEQTVFREAFRFPETVDQEQAISAVLDDLQAPRPMDRLVAGDAGFGKTEVAMNAAFAVTSNGGQVVILAPTTLLVQQHYRNFRDRFADWPVRVAQLSRFAAAGAAAKTIAGLRDGTVDIVIGTHALLQKKIRYKRLGLIIIDEEHRFGVRQKEQIKSMRVETDMLSLTATPIPRTLDMALSGIRDISIISTPPARRQPVTTQVRQWDSVHINEAIERELRRGGQIFFVHNRVRTITEAAQRLQAAVPGVDIRIAHGQMRERELESIMTDFSHRRFPVLACTAIIENGIDIPTANTIIVDDAHKFGLAQLYQLRGRVGRSHHNAYACLIAPPASAMNEQARQRLEAICAMDSLGIGLGLALQDLEIRGAGVLLGEEQSGHINSIGYGAYLDLVRRAVQDLQHGGDIDPFSNQQVDIDMPFAALLPEDYIPDVQQRLQIYRQLAATDQEQLADWRMELVDRYGQLPPPADMLLRLHTIRLKAEQLGLQHIKWYARSGRISFGSNSKLRPQHIISVIEARPELQLADQDSIRINKAFNDQIQHCDYLTQLLSSLKTD